MRVSPVILLTWLVPFLLLTACSGEHDSPTPADSSRLSLDWTGTYSGVLPCASCPGIETTITLHDDGSFERSLRYIDKNPVPARDSGSFAWNDAGGIVTLTSDEQDSQSYQVGEHRLFHLDKQGRRIAGELANRYALDQHLHDPAIEDRRWRLVELNGEPVTSDDQHREPYILLRSDALRINGNTSCNTFNGPYAIKSGQRIDFGNNIAMTLMACPDMDREQAFVDVLRRADNYTMGDDGTMTLNRARMAPLARFVAAVESE